MMKAKTKRRRRRRSNVVRLSYSPSYICRFQTQKLSLEPQQLGSFILIDKIVDSGCFLSTGRLQKTVNTIL